MGGSPLPPQLRPGSSSSLGAFPRVEADDTGYVAPLTGSEHLPGPAFLPAPMTAGAVLYLPGVGEGAYVMVNERACASQQRTLHNSIGRTMQCSCAWLTPPTTYHVDGCRSHADSGSRLSRTSSGTSIIGAASIEERYRARQLARRKASNANGAPLGAAAAER